MRTKKKKRVKLLQDLSTSEIMMLAIQRCLKDKADKIKRREKRNEQISDEDRLRAKFVCWKNDDLPRYLKKTLRRKTRLGEYDLRIYSGVLPWMKKIEKISIGHGPHGNRPIWIFGTN